MSTRRGRLIRPVLEAGAPHPAAVSYICETLAAIARQMGVAVPDWREQYLIDYHALAAAQAAEADAPEA